MSPTHLAAIDQALREGARANGFDIDHWTLARIATVIQRLTGVSYHPGHVWELLRHRLHYRLQRPPAARSSVTSRRSPAGSPRTGLRICRNARRRRAVIVFWDESGASLLPVTCRTWAPVGHTPVIRHRCKWKRASMAAAICYGSLGGGASVAFHRQLGAYNTQTLIGALGELRVFLGGQKATLVWDGLPAHRSREMAAWLGRQRSWLVTSGCRGMRLT